MVGTWGGVIEHEVERGTQTWQKGYRQGLPMTGRGIINEVSVWNVEGLDLLPGFV